ncbi:Enhancer of polycomb-like protein 2 [Auxenochlorella protothecoides]|uniref:Enhancer of polycomb-like protein n=1 Tax=Auxenochlorella protothecoides TaxID=3075 RepID=A0A087STQ1_AUXPR|nr:Enhancer of polycomb-like protein 2 [Auxenochlorella protothecoides]KFM29105.1 Enhancer of polycomb-like protein 2 [Auxenochlorella protothecoides]
MASTRAFRARPVDISRALPIVRDLTLLDSTEGLPAREVVHNHAALDADNEKPKMISQADGKGGKEIPIPGVKTIPSYERDYLPTWKDQNTYIRDRGTAEQEFELVEYDLDSEDERWLQDLNNGQVINMERLPKARLEMMLWKLEIHNAAATDRALAFAGASAAERMSVAACSTTDHMPREEALQMLEESCTGRDVLRATVYDYWLEKRRRLGRPMLRRLQALTPPNDNNPYNVFRPRERVHRPQTRRRRENNEDSLDKLRMVRENVLKALDLFEMLVKRERKKRDLLFVATDLQQIQLKLRHEPRGRSEQIEEQYLAASKSKSVKRPLGFELPEAAPVTNNKLLEKLKKTKRRACTPRIGRGGRLIMDRCQPFLAEWEAPAEDEESKQLPLYEQPNPYTEWLEKRDLAQAALQKLQAGEKLRIPQSLADGIDGVNGHAETAKVKEEPDGAVPDENGSLGAGGAARRAGSRPSRSGSRQNLASQ